LHNNGGKIMEKVKVKWLGEASIDKGGVTWGIPWKKGSLSKNTLLKAEAKEEKKSNFRAGRRRIGRMAVLNGQLMLLLLHKLHLRSFI
jgi:hypothetical protein